MRNLGLLLPLKTVAVVLERLEVDTPVVIADILEADQAFVAILDVIEVEVAEGNRGNPIRVHRILIIETNPQILHGFRIVEVHWQAEALYEALRAETHEALGIVRALNIVDSKEELVVGADTHLACGLKLLKTY